MNVIFLDRDGLLIVDPLDYRVDTKEKIELFPDTLSALKFLSENDFAVVIITNQAGIEEGLLTEDEFWDIHNEVLAQLQPSGVRILKTYMNGEMNKPDATEWRKPGPNMLLQAGKDLSLDLSKIYMLGDNQSDVVAGIRAGCKGGILVKTATGKEVVSPDAIYTAENLTDAVTYVVEKS